MKATTVRLDDELDEQISKYAAYKKIKVSDAIRELLREGVDPKSNENELIKEIKNLQGELKNTQTKLNSHAERIVKISIKSQKYILAIWHLVQISIFFRAKDKGLDDNESVKTRDESANYAMTFAIKDLSKKE